MKTPLLWLAAALLAASCAPDSGSGSTARPRKSLSERLNEDGGYKQDTEGNWVKKGDKRSSFENQGESPYFKGDYAKNNYKAGEYRKKSWWGNKQYDRQAYAGNTDGSRFQKDSRFDGQGARESGSAAAIPDPYQTGAYATGAAREAGGSQLAKPGNAEIEKRREIYQAPEIIDWREQRNLSVDGTRGILGR